MFVHTGKILLSLFLQSKVFPALSASSYVKSVAKVTVVTYLIKLVVFHMHMFFQKKELNVDFV